MGLKEWAGLKIYLHNLGLSLTRSSDNKEIKINQLRYNIDFKEVMTGTAVSIQFNLPSGKREFLDAAIPWVYSWCKCKICRLR